MNMSDKDLLIALTLALASSGRVAPPDTLVGHAKSILIALREELDKL